MRSSGLSWTGVGFVPKTAAPPGGAQVCAVSGGKLILSESAPQTVSNRGRYLARESLYTMQAVSGFPISWVSTGGPCDCSASGLLSRYPVARESQKFPPKNNCCSSLY